MSYYDDAIRDWAAFEGAFHTDTQWLLSNMDSWVRNPHYHGPEQPHPECDCDDDGNPIAFTFTPGAPAREYTDEEIPF